MLSKKTVLLFLIFLLALILRFLYFPQNTYFGFDQARDAYAVREILGGHLKITGPPTANGIFHHGVLYYYIFAPFYLFAGGDPSAISAFLRVLNASGVFILYFITLALFGSIAALLASFLFAISYEQTQFSLFLNHPSFAVMSVLIFYLGLSTWIFRKRAWGLLLALFGLGLSIQFEFIEVQLIGVFILYALFFRKEIHQLNFRNILLGLFALLLPLSTYIISETKNNFLIIKQIPGMFINSTALAGGSSFQQFLFIINRHFQDNFSANPIVASILAIAFLVTLSIFLIKNVLRKEFIFLSLWFFGGLMVYFLIDNDAYFYNTGTSISLLIFTAFLVSKIFSKNKPLAFSILALIVISNIFLITKNNPLGPNQKINPQIGLLLKDQEKMLDFIYQSAQGKDFAVNTLTMPYNINTTWSYLFEWYGAKIYGYTPVWGGDAAKGFPGNLQIERARSKLPDKRFLIIEPLEGIPTYLIDSFITNEKKYSTTIEIKRIGTMQVWVQQPKQ